MQDFGVSLAQGSFCCPLLICRDSVHDFSVSLDQSSAGEDSVHKFGATLGRSFAGGDSLHKFGVTLGRSFAGEDSVYKFGVSLGRSFLCCHGVPTLEGISGCICAKKMLDCRTVEGRRQLYYCMPYNKHEPFGR